MAKYIHDIDIGFSIDSDFEDIDDIPFEEVQKCLKRFEGLTKDNWRDFIAQASVVENIHN